MTCSSCKDVVANESFELSKFNSFNSFQEQCDHLDIETCFLLQKLNFLAAIRLPDD